MLVFFKKGMVYFSEHAILNSVAHFAAGFGLALLLQQLLVGNAFLPSVVAWLLIGIAVVIHIVAVVSK